MKKKKILILTSVLLIIVIIAISIFLIYKFDSFTLEILEINDNWILGKSIKNDKYYLVYKDSKQTIHKNFQEIDITALEEGDIIYVLNEMPKVKNSIAFVTSDGHSIDDCLDDIKLIILLKEISK